MAEDGHRGRPARLRDMLWYVIIGAVLVAALILWLNKTSRPSRDLHVASEEQREQKRVQEITATLNEAQSLLATPDKAGWERAESLLEELIQKEPLLPEARLVYGRAALQLDDPTLAERTAHELLERSPNLPQAHVLLAAVAERRQDWPTVATELSKAVEIASERNEPVLLPWCIGAANAFLKSHDPASWAKAQALLEPLIEKDPSGDIRRLAMGAAMKREDYAGATRMAEAYVKASPESPEAYFMLAQPPFRREDYGTAAENIEKAIELATPKGPAPLLWYLQAADARFRQKDDAARPKALAHLTAVVDRLNPAGDEAATSAFLLIQTIATQQAEDADVQFEAARAAVRMGHRKQAETRLDAARKLKPDDPRWAALAGEIEHMPTTAPTSAPATAPATTTPAFSLP